MDYSSLGTVTGACHAPVAGGQGKAPRIPVPIEKPADFEMDGREDFQNSLCLWAAALKQIRLLKGWRSRRGFCKVGTTFKPRQASAEAAHPVPPRRAHDTLQPQDESIIRVERFVPWYLKGDGALAYPFKAFAERVATE